MNKGDMTHEFTEQLENGHGTDSRTKDDDEDEQMVTG
jgi:hypothetical protein